MKIICFLFWHYKINHYLCINKKQTKQNIMQKINFNGAPTVTITEMQFELELSYIGMSFKGGWRQWSNRDIEMLEEKLNVSANPILPYEGFIKLHDLNYVWED